MTIIDTINVIERAPITFPQVLGLIFMGFITSLCIFLFIIAGICIVDDEDPKAILLSIGSAVVGLPLCIYIITTLIPSEQLVTRYVAKIDYNISYSEYAELTDKYKIIDELTVHDSENGDAKLLLIEEINTSSSDKKINLEDYIDKIIKNS